MSQPNRCEQRDHVPITLLQKIQTRKKLGQSLLLLQTLPAFCGDCISCRSCIRNHPEPLSTAGYLGTQCSSNLCLKHHILESYGSYNMHMLHVLILNLMG